MRARLVAVAGLFAAAAFLCLVLAGLLPTGRLSLLAAASLATAGARMAGGTGAAVGTWLAGSVLGLLFSPLRLVALVYFIFFGPYPLVKSAAERWGGWWEWALKLLHLNLALATSLGGLWLLGLPWPPPTWLGLGWLVAQPALVLYDHAFSGIIIYLEDRLRAV
ncbi:MAG: hypothetical protein AB1331_01225 [Bacillota bacterium]